MKILLIEDDKEISKMLRSYLMTENFEVVCASDGQMACEAFDTDTYSIVLLDLMIPKLTGMDVMKHIRKKSTVRSDHHYISKRFRFRQNPGAWPWSR